MVDLDHSFLVQQQPIVASAQMTQEQSEGTLAFPLARITTCGRLAIETVQTVQVDQDGNVQAIYGPPDPALLASKGTSTALILLALLVSQPGCFASKDWLSEKLGHGRSREDEEEDEREGMKRVDNVVSRLRFLLVPAQAHEQPAIQQMRRRLVEYRRASGESGPGYQLAGMPWLWLDVTEIEVHIKRARRLEQFGHDGLAEWRAAYDLAMEGRFLPGEVYSDWAEWRRQQIETHLWDSVQVLWHRAVEQGPAGEVQAVRILREYWQSHPTNEDALRPLLELLGKRECFGEAQACYDRLCATLADEGKRPDQRTREIIEAQQAMQLQRAPRLTFQHVSSHDLQPPLLSCPLPGYTLSHRGQTPRGTQTQQEEASLSLPAEQRTLLSLLGFRNETMAFDPSKRQALQKIATALLALAGTPAAFELPDPEPWERLLMAQRKHDPAASLNAATLEQFEHLLTTSWHLCDENQFEIAEGILASFLPHLLELPRQNPRTASLTAHSLRLQSILAHHGSRLNEKVSLCERSVQYARQAEDANTLVLALIELAGAYEYEKQQKKRLQALQEALFWSKDASFLVQSRMYSRHAVVLAESQRMREAHFYITFARDVFPDEPMKDPLFALADSSIFRFSYHAGLVGFHTDPAHAFHLFETYKHHPSGTSIPARIRLEIANGQSKVAIRVNDAETYALLLEEVLTEAVKIGSKKRFDEAYAIFQHDLPTSWQTLQPIQALSERYHLNREE